MSQYATVDTVLMAFFSGHLVGAGVLQTGNGNLKATRTASYGLVYVTLEAYGKLIAVKMFQVAVATVPGSFRGSTRVGCLVTDSTRMSQSVSKYQNKLRAMIKEAQFNRGVNLFVAMSDHGSSGVFTWCDDRLNLNYDWKCE